MLMSYLSVNFRHSPKLYKFVGNLPALISVKNLGSGESLIVVIRHISICCHHKGGKNETGKPHRAVYSLSGGWVGCGNKMCSRMKTQINRNPGPTTRERKYKKKETYEHKRKKGKKGHTKHASHITQLTHMLTKRERGKETESSRIERV